MTSNSLTENEEHDITSTRVDLYSHQILLDSNKVNTPWQHEQLITSMIKIDTFSLQNFF